MTTEKLLEVQQLKTYFDTDEGIVKAVDNISFTIHKGETIGIVGESGSGKSVTSLSIMRLLQSPPGRIAGGKILLHHQNDVVDLLALPEKEMQGYRGNTMAMIFQEPMTSLNPVFRCGDQVTEAILQHQNISRADAKKRCLQLFEKVQLPDPLRIFEAYPHQISGGQKQRVMIAMAMSCNPSLLIADEPTTALDVTVQQSILQLMQQLKTEQNASVIFITHDLGVVAEIADRVIVMYKGKIVEQGTVQEIFTKPQHPYTKGLLACRPPLDVRLSRLPVVQDFMEIKEVEGEIQLLEKEKSVSELLESYTQDTPQYYERQTQLQQQQAILKVEALQTWFPKTKNFWGQATDYVKAVDNVSFEVFPGETLGLVGESGCGKSTLGRTILRLTPARSGAVWYQGQNVFDLSEKELRQLRKRIQIIFQDPYSSLNPRMPIGNAILEPMQVHRLYDNDAMRKEKVLELLDTVNLNPKHFHRYPHEFSGGQRQRICIARALALQPEFIICDESVSALDVSVQAQILNLLLDLQQKYGLTYIFISHDLSVVKFISDRMMVMKDGRIEELGLAEDIYKQAQSPYTQKLIGAIPKGVW